MAEPRRILRFPLLYRLEHWVLVASFTTLAVTGLIQKFATFGLSLAILRVLGGVENTRIIHHSAAVVMMVEAVYHLGVIGYRVIVRHTALSMLPGMSDIRVAVQALLYNLGLSPTRPQQGRYTFEEKLEYWAVIWGTAVMALTGFMMWNPIATTRLLPGQYIPAAKVAHGSEAILAVLSILIWHVYQVHLRTFNKSMFNGTLDEQEMLEEHPIELADLKAGVAHRPLDPQALARRRRIFIPAYSVFAAVMLAGIYGFVTFEHTAVTTLPPAENVTVYVPLTPTPLPTAVSSPTPSGAAPASWDQGFAALFTSRCGACHGSPSGINGLDLSSYAGALKGGVSGPGIVPGKPDESQIVIKQSAGNHPGQLSPEELAQVRAWIAAGAPER